MEVDSADFVGLAGVGNRNSIVCTIISFVSGCTRLSISVALPIQPLTVVEHNLLKYLKHMQDKSGCSGCSDWSYRISLTSGIHSNSECGFLPLNCS